MRKFVLAALAVASVCTAVGSAHALVVTGAYDMRNGDGSNTIFTSSYVLTSNDAIYASWLRFTPDQTFNFSQLTSLSVLFNSPTFNANGDQTPLNAGGGGGAPRLTLALSSTGGTTVDKSFHIHLGTSPGFVDVPLSLNNFSGDSVLNNDAGRYDLAPAGGSTFTDYNAALALAGNWRVLRYTVFLDSFGDADKTLKIFSIDAEIAAVPEASSIAFGSLACCVGGAMIYFRKRGAKLAT